MLDISPKHDAKKGSSLAVLPAVAADTSVSFDTRGQYITFLEKGLAKQHEILARQQEQLTRQNELIARYQKTLGAIYDSHGWHVLLKYYRLRDRIVPPDSIQRRIAKAFFRVATGTTRGLLRQIRNDPVRPFNEGYSRWIKTHEPNAADLEEQRRFVFDYQPTISILVPTYQTSIPFLRAMIQSVLDQTYPNWELCVADGQSLVKVQEVLDSYRKMDRRIRVEFLPSNDGIAANSNAALALATGDYVALLDHDDTLAPFALFEVVRAVNQDRNADLLYSDEDTIDQTGAERSNPHFKPDWSPDALRSHNYICHLAIMRRSVVHQVGEFRTEHEGSQDYDLVLRVSERARKIVHIPKVLYHWRIHAKSVTGEEVGKMYAYEAAKKALADHLLRQHVDGYVQDGPVLGTYQVKYSLASQPLISIIIPNQDHPEMLARCLESVKRSSYCNYEIVIVENHSKRPETFSYYQQLEQDSKVRILNWTQPFNYSSVNNEAIRQARGDVVLLLNNDVEAINADWLERMLEHVLRQEVGAVGAKLYYPNETIQHAGVIIGIGGVASHSHTFHQRESLGYGRRLVITHNLSAVTAACLMLRKKVFEQVGGLDERFIIAFNDIDLCLKIRQQGYLVVWTPHAELYHHESVTRGHDLEDPVRLARLQGEEDLFRGKWLEVLRAGDPYYNPNLSLQDGNFSLRL